MVANMSFQVCGAEEINISELDKLVEQVKSHTGHKPAYTMDSNNKIVTDSKELEILGRNYLS